MLELNDVTVGFGDAPMAVTEATMTVARGERLLVCGAAGGAKTTLLNVAGGIIPRLVAPRHFSGSVSFDGQPLSTLSKDALFTKIGIVTQNVEDQLWDLGVEDLIAFPLENRGVEKKLIRRRLQILLDELELNPLRGRRVLTLSGGERRMVAIAAALAATPVLLVLDEPTTGLDPAARARLVRILAKLADEVPSLLVAEQDPGAFKSVAENVRLLVSGRLSEAVAARTIMTQQEPWLEAGILPPNHRATCTPSFPVGDVLLSVSGIRTRLARPDGVPVLRDVSLQIRAGEHVALIGRNGAGKTTLFQSILGLAKLAAGSIRIGGEPADGWTVARRARAIAYLPQNMRRILFNMTVLEEVIFSMTAGAAADDLVRREAHAALEKYEIKALAEANPFALSTRQQALLGLACADAAQASIAILDEPLLARDLQGRRMLDLFIGSMLSSGRAIMLISHDLDLVQDVASRTLILDEGQIVFDGAPQQAWASSAFSQLGWPAPTALSTGAAA
ncbi:ATP-binding cassette domain-containing protein [Mesorhizobium sp. M6A.T.Ce.TU.016.01.1.1]|uniref:ABC transporter ATP-binding protein n=1 Tax=Mesorhizobium sp. M6A.T.Ce.TU.016.01.1.1 TaxID=2496783 RepID=UPI000FCB0E21|nr:ATP-binding cassette domain-containing protein [Mesorhizobium sp. M6A.T.Ce.TU.016.01.1.1]RUU31454.1 ATP-binding cassette domain-containing protein [Mesorhizobium sp. M6A.T.Ce.TU.016.01.1.1]